MGALIIAVVQLGMTFVGVNVFAQPPPAARSRRLDLAALLYDNTTILNQLARIA